MAVVDTAAQVRAVTSKTYRSARLFLEALETESLFPGGTQKLASPFFLGRDSQEAS